MRRRICDGSGKRPLTGLVFDRDGMPNYDGGILFAGTCPACGRVRCHVTRRSGVLHWHIDPRPLLPIHWRAS